MIIDRVVNKKSEYKCLFLLVIVRGESSDKEESISIYKYVCLLIANKAEGVIDQILGRFYEERRMTLELMPYQAGYPI